jgi:hypothetical protein
MGWERRGKKAYFYRKQRQGRRVVSTYIGAGAAGAAESLAASGRRAERESALTARRVERERQEEVDRASQEWSAAVALAAEVVLLAAGYRRRGRGPWRRSRA